MNLKKTFFIILFILLMWGICLSLAEEETGIINEIQACYSNAVESATFLTLFQGGAPQYELGSFPFKLENQDYFIKYGLYDGKNVLLSKEQIISNIESYIEELSYVCLDESYYEGYTIENSIADTALEINENTIIARTKVDIMITNPKGDVETLDPLDKTLNIRFGYIYNAVNSTVNELIKNPGNVNRDFMLNYNGLKLSRVANVPDYENTVIYSVLDLRSNIGGISTIFMFGVKTKEEIPPLPPITCKDECSQDSKECGSDQFHTNHYQECGNFDDDECLEWGSFIGCEEGEQCLNGECVKVDVPKCEVLRAIWELNGAEVKKVYTNDPVTLKVVGDNSNVCNARLAQLEIGPVGKMFNSVFNDVIIEEEWGDEKKVDFYRYSVSGTDLKEVFKSSDLEVWEKTCETDPELACPLPECTENGKQIIYECIGGKCVSDIENIECSSVCGAQSISYEQCYREFGADYYFDKDSCSCKPIVHECKKQEECFSQELCVGMGSKVVNCMAQEGIGFGNVCQPTNDMNICDNRCEATENAHETCESKGDVFDTGTCGCTHTPVCGDGLCEAGEVCDSDCKVKCVVPTCIGYYEAGEVDADGCPQYECGECNPGDTRVCDGVSLGICNPGYQTCGDDYDWGSVCLNKIEPRQEVCDSAQSDEDCDGEANEGCDCVTGDVKECGSNIGECKQGKQTCVLGKWSECVGGTGPVNEECDKKDNDCDGEVDEIDECTIVPPPPQPMCGNGLIEVGEVCDGSGCEPGYMCNSRCGCIKIPDVSECGDGLCDDGEDENTCGIDCKLIVCQDAGCDEPEITGTDSDGCPVYKCGVEPPVIPPIEPPVVPPEKPEICTFGEKDCATETIVKTCIKNPVTQKLKWQYDPCEKGLQCLDGQCLGHGEEKEEVKVREIVSSAGLSAQLKRAYPGVVNKQASEAIFDLLNLDSSHKLQGYIRCRSSSDVTLSAGEGIGSSGAQVVSPMFDVGEAPSQRSIFLSFNSMTVGNKPITCTFKYVSYKLTSKGSVKYLAQNGVYVDELSDTLYRELRLDNTLNFVSSIKELPPGMLKQPTKPTKESGVGFVVLIGALCLAMLIYRKR